MHKTSLMIPAPDGTEIEIAEDIASEMVKSFSMHDTTAIREHYETHGYVVVRGVLPKTICDQAISSFAQEVKPYDGVLYRQPSSGTAEKHVLSPTGLMLNSILNVQDLDDRKFPTFRERALAIVSNSEMATVIHGVLGEKATIVQTMFFEGNPETWPHQDTYYLDSTVTGRMVAAWIAVENIDAGAGRFFVYPGSHRLELATHNDEINIASNHHRYKQLVIDTIRGKSLQCVAPALEAGDVLLWNSRTIHGSLKTIRHDKSRRSFTAHYIPGTTGLLQFQKREVKLHPKSIGPFQINCPKDQSSLKNRLILAIEGQFPGPFYAVKRAAIKLLIR